MWNFFKTSSVAISTSIRFLCAFQVYRSCASSMLSVTQDKLGGPNELYLTKSKEVPTIKSNQLLIRVHATALNRADLLMREGKYPGLKEVVTLGLEVAGIVESTGSNESKWKVGDKVMALVNGGGYAEFVAVNEDHVMPIPFHLSFNEAAAIPEVWLTAYQLLYFVGKLEKNDIVLIHGGGSGVGTAAIQLVKLAGAQSIVTAGTTDKINFAKKLGALEGINYKEEEFSSRVLNITNNKGVNLILDCVGGSYWKQNADCLATDGCWVVFGLLGGGNVDGPLLSKILGKRASIIGTTLKARSDSYKTRLINDFAENALPHFKPDHSNLKPIVDSIYSIETVADAHKYMASNKSNGKIILEVKNESDSHSEL